MTPPRVTIVQRVMTHYRVPFFTALHERLTAAGIHLEVLHGQPNADEASLGNSGTLPGARVIRNRYLPVGDRSLCWQPCLGLIRNSDLVVVEQASRLLVNYVLLARRAVGGPSVAWWGHGRNLGSQPGSKFGETLKERLAQRADWWFAYTDSTRAHLTAIGVNPRRITVVQNATDTRVVARQRAKLTPTDQVRLRSAIGLHPGPVGVVLGSLYPAKRVGFILSVADLVRKTMPDFQLVVIGDGPDRGIIESASRTRPWIHMLGAITGDAMVNAAATGDIIIHPGALGLAVLDAFALELPLLTIDGPAHGPEIAYLEHGLNGWVLPGSTETGTYAAAVVRLLSDDHARAELRTGCRRAAQRYTVEAMADNFAAGIGAALQRRHKRIRNG